MVQPGVINDDLRAACAEHGLWYPPDPASSPWSTIGGNVATNAGGICCVKYGVTRDYVLALEIVTGTGELVRVGRRTAKGVAGYDLAGLMVGSEGTLGSSPRSRCGCAPRGPWSTPSPGYFDSLVDAGRRWRRWRAAGVIPSALELVDRHCLKAVDAWKNIGLAPTRARCCWPGSTPPALRATAEAERMLACFEAGATWAAGPPTSRRRTRCSRHGGSPTRRWSGSARC